MKKLVFVLFWIITFISCEDIIEVVDISDKTVTILAPTDQAVLNVTDVTFSWETLEDAETYQLQIANPSFENALQIVVDSTLEGSHLSATLEASSYEWRIRAKNSGYDTAYTTQSFTIE